MSKAVLAIVIIMASGPALADRLNIKMKRAAIGSALSDSYKDQDVAEKPVASRTEKRQAHKPNSKAVMVDVGDGMGAGGGLAGSEDGLKFRSGDEKSEPKESLADFQNSLAGQ